jgi:hypothetical protein
MLTHEEKYHFDLHGYIVLKGVVPPEDIGRMIGLCDEWHGLDEADLPVPLRTYTDKNTKETAARAINHVEYADEAFQRLALNREIMRCVMALTRNCPQLLGAALTRNTRDSDDIPFHNGMSGDWRLPANDYQATSDGPFATFLNAAVSLVDVPSGSGFVCVPGSHKAYFERPEHIDLYTEPPTVVNVCPNAGDVVLFTEALCHGGRRWTADYARRTVFVRYAASYASWTPTHGPMEEHRAMLSDDLYELHQRAAYNYRKNIVDRLLRELGDT